MANEPIVEALKDVNDRPELSQREINERAEQSDKEVAKAKKEAPVGISIKLLKDHTHAGKAYKATNVIRDVDAPTAEWLEKHGIGKRM